MKKQTLLLAVFCIFASAIFAQAPFIAVLDIDSNLATNHSATAPIYNPLGTIVRVKLQTLEAGSTEWKTRPMYVTGATNFLLTQDSLNAGRLHYVRAISYNAAGTDSFISNTKTVSTKPSAQPISIQYIDTMPALPQSGIIFSASSVGSGSYAYGVDAANGNIITATTFNLTGNVTDTVFITNAPGDSIPSILLVIRSNDGTSVNISPVNSPAFFAPALTGPQMETATPFKNQDSINVSLNVTSLGNGGTAVLSYWLRDVISGNYEITPTNQSVTTTGTIFIGKKVASWKTNRLFEFHALIANAQGLSDTVSLFVRTDQVPYTGTTITNVAPGTNTYAATWSVDPLGSYDSSTVKRMTITRNTVVLWDSVVSITAPTMITVSGIAGMPGTSHTDYLSVTNLAGLTTMVSYSVPMQSVPSNGKPTIGSITDVSPSEVRLEGVQVHVASGNTTTVFVKSQNMNTGAIASKVAQSHITTNGPIPNISITGLEGNVNYCHIVVDSNELSGELIYSDQECRTTIAPIAPLLSDITQDDVLTTDDILAVNFKGNSNGYQGVLEASLYEDNIPVASMAPTSVGTGSFNFPFSWNNRSPNTEYGVSGTLQTSTGSNQSSITKYFWTDAFTGVSEIPKNAYGMRVRVNAITGFGQEIMTGTCNDVFQALAGSGLLVAITPIDETGQRIGNKVYKHGFLKN